MKKQRNQFMKSRFLYLIFVLLIQSVTASENKSDTDNNADNDAENEAENVQQSSPPPNLKPQIEQKKLSQSIVSKTSSKKSLSSSSDTRNPYNSSNGALYGSSNTFPVMDSNGKVFVAPDYYSKLDHGNIPSGYSNSNGHFNSPYYWSSENTPTYPSMLGRRARGIPTHFDPNINDMLSSHRINRPESARSAYYNPVSVPLSPSAVLETERIDQGPLAPAPKSLLEKAGWWEYLALLFGETGDATAVRLILHRLTKLAQLQLEGVEATKVQATTAFLAHHFKPLLVSSFQDFVYDPDYTRTSSVWSSDPGFSNIVRKLVDRMDFFGAQEELERIFGPNTNVAVSFGMRQPEWLRLKLILEQIAWDLRHPNDLIGLWSPAWTLSVPQKLSILSYASNPHANTPLDLNLPKRDSILARINLITNGESPSDPALIEKESKLEQAHFKYALLQSSGTLCKSLKSDSTKGKTKAPETTDDSQTKPQQKGSQSPTTVEAEGFKRRVSDYCELVNITPNFNQFCQTNRDFSTPIASLLSASSPLFEEKVIKYVNHLERLFWAFTWVGASQDARESLATLTNQLKFLGPREAHAKKGRGVPSGVSESIHVRLEYMQAVHKSTQNNIQLIGSSDVAYIFSLLNYAHLPEALSEWERRYSSIATRLEGYPGGLLLSNGEEQLLYQQARDVRIALLIYKYPRSVYVPCLSKGLLTRDPATDLTLLNLTLSLDNRPSHRGTNIDPLIPEMSARSLYLRALYLAGKDLEAARVARELVAVSGSEKGVDSGLINEFLACTELCGSATRNPCAAEQTYTSLLTGISPKLKKKSQSETQDSGNGEEQEISSHKSEEPKPMESPSKSKPSTAKTVYTVGKELSSRLCRLSRNTAADALSLRYGKVLTTQATFSAFKRYADSMATDGRIVNSKLKAGDAESILPWFGSLPSAPVDDILSFAPTHKSNFVAQVGIEGVPLINLSSGTTIGKGSQAEKPKVSDTDSNQTSDESEGGQEEESEGSPSQSGQNPNETQSTSPKISNSDSNNSKIFVLGKQYNSNILTDSNGSSSTGPKTELVNGIYQLATPTAASSAKKQATSSPENPGENAEGQEGDTGEEGSGQSITGSENDHDQAQENSEENE